MLSCLGALFFLSLSQGWAAPATAPSPSPAPKPTEAVTRADARLLLLEFQKAQRSEMKALEHRFKMESQELKASQGARRKEWEQKERDARHQFFKDHAKGAERREYVRSFLERRKALIAILADEKARRRQEYEVRRKAIAEEQSAKMKEFKEVLGHGERPPARLWPN